MEKKLKKRRKNKGEEKSLKEKWEWQRRQFVTTKSRTHINNQNGDQTYHYTTMMEWFILENKI